MRIHSVEHLAVVDPKEWDALAESMGGGFYHCYAAAIYSADTTASQPAFLVGRDERGEPVGVAVCSIGSSSVWPFSRFCKVATFESLPVTADRDEETEASFLAAIEERLREFGVFKVTTASYQSLNSEPVLSRLKYQLHSRSEYLLDLSQAEEQLWRAMKKGRRGDVRRAERLGAKTVFDDSDRAMDLVWHFHELSLNRRGINVRAYEGRTRRALLGLMQSGRCKLVVTYWQDEPVAAILAGIFGRQAFGMFMGSSDSGCACKAPSQIIWESIRQFKAEGREVFNLGGAKEEEQGLCNFKLEFGPRAISAPGGAKVLSSLGSNLHRIRGVLRPRR